MTTKIVMPSPSDIAYIEPGIFAYIMDVLRERHVDYKSSHAELVRNEVIKELRCRIVSSIQPK